MEAKFRRALQLHQQGQLADAERIFLTLLRQQPKHFETLHFLGIIAFQTKRPERAADLIGRALTVNPNNAEAYSNLGAVLSALGRHEAALSNYDKAIKLKPNLARPYFNRGLVLGELGRLEDAVVSYDRAIALQANYPAALNNRGNALRDLGRHEEALLSYDWAIARQPGGAESHNNRGAVLIELGRPEEALSNLDRAIRLQPDHAVAHNNRGNALRDLHRPAEALPCYDRAIALRPDLAEAHNNRGNTLRDLGRPAEALLSFDAAIRLNPELAQVHSNRGNVLCDLGRHGEALADYDRAIALQPDLASLYCDRGLALLELARPEASMADFEQAIALRPDLAMAHSGVGSLLLETGRIAEARDRFERAIALEPRRPSHFLLLSRTTKLRPDNPHLAAMLTLAEAIETFNNKDKMDLHFALGKALDDIGEHQRAFEHQAAGNALRRPMVKYDEAETIARLGRTRTIFSADFLHQRRGHGEPSSVPVFIVGMPRSGSTLIEQMLASHPNVFGAGEVDLFTASGRGLGLFTPGRPFPDSVPDWTDAELQALGRDYVSRMRALAADQPSAERMTDKALSNFANVGLISLALPNARVIHLHRDPIDTCLSGFSIQFKALEYTCDLAELGRYYRAYSCLMAHWRAVLPPGLMLEVRYEDVVEDFEREARRIVAFCGLDWDAACLRFHETERRVRTASVAQVRQPVYRDSLRRWRPDQEALRPLLEALDGRG